MTDSIDDKQCGAKYRCRIHLCRYRTARRVSSLPTFAWHIGLRDLAPTKEFLTRL